MAIFSKEKYTFDRVVRIAITILLLWGLYQLVDYLKEVLIPFVIAAILAYIFHPFVSFLQNKAKIKNRVAAVLLTVFIVIGTFTVIGLIIVPMISKEIQQMGNNITELTIKLKEEKHLPEKIREFVLNLAENPEVRDVIQSDNFEDFLVNAVKKLMPGLWNFFTGTINVVIGIFGVFIIFLYTIFLLIDFDSFIRDSKKLIPPDIKQKVLTIFGDFRGAMGNYFRAVFLKAVILAVVFSVGFSIIDLPLAILIGIISGMLNMIPYMQLLAILPTSLLAIAYSLETGKVIWPMLGLVALVFIIAQVIEELILNPRIMGKAMSLNPAEVLLSLSIWAKLLGFLGLIIALPVTYLIKLYYFRLMDKQEKEYRIEQRQAKLEEKAIKGNTKQQKTDTKE